MGLAFSIKKDPKDMTPLEREEYELDKKKEELQRTRDYEKYGVDTKQLDSIKDYVTSKESDYRFISDKRKGHSISRRFEDLEESSDNYKKELEKKDEQISDLVGKLASTDALCGILAFFVAILVITNAIQIFG